jgi:hypothetical protein
MHKRCDVERERKNAAFAHVDAPAISEEMERAVPGAVRFWWLSTLAKHALASTSGQFPVRILD